MQLVVQAGHRRPIDDLRIGRRGGIDVHRRQVVGCLHAGPPIEGHGIQDLLALGLHRLEWRGVAWSAAGMFFVVGMAQLIHGSSSLLPGQSRKFHSLDSVTAYFVLPYRASRVQRTRNVCADSVNSLWPD